MDAGDEQFNGATPFWKKPQVMEGDMQFMGPEVHRILTMNQFKFVARDLTYFMQRHLDFIMVAKTEYDYYDRVEVVKFKKICKDPANKTPKHFEPLMKMNTHYTVRGVNGLEVGPGTTNMT